MADDVLERLQRRLAGAGVAFDLVRHEPVYTSQQAAAARGTSLSSGAKALVCKADDHFYLFVLPADRKLASKQARRQHGWKSLRFASPEEVESITGLAPGSIPPFGSLFGLRTWCDRLLTSERTMNFNAGDHSVSISMSVQDYLAVESPELTTLAE